MTEIMYIADVGETDWEEIDIGIGGANYGWSTMEGDHCYEPSSGCSRSGLTLPIHEYPHDGSNKSITGGHVYRGTAVPTLVGRYVYADYVDGRIWALEYDGSQVVENTLLKDTSLFLSSFGLDQNNELYVCAFDGKIYRFVSTSTSTEDPAVTPDAFVLHGNYPNPFNSRTRISFDLSREARVSVEIFNVLGKRVRLIDGGRLAPGRLSVEWNGRGSSGETLPSGAYLYVVEVDGRAVGRSTMVLLK